MRGQDFWLLHYGDGLSIEAITAEHNRALAQRHPNAYGLDEADVRDAIARIDYAIVIEERRRFGPPLIVVCPSCNRPLPGE